MSWTFLHCGHLKFLVYALAVFWAFLAAFFSSLALRFSFFACSRWRFACVCGPGLAMIWVPVGDKQLAAISHLIAACRICR